MENESRLTPFMRVVALAIALVVPLGTAPVAFGASFYWDPDTSTAGNNTDGTALGGTGTWDTVTANWWDLASLVPWPNTSADIAIFNGPYVAGAPTLNTVTLAAGGVTANQLSFLRSGYTVTADTLTLAGASAGLQANLGESATLSSLITGSAGLTKTGGGSIRLTNALNNYTGITTIANGSLIISDPAALGGTGTVSILTNNNTPSNTACVGFSGGSLVLDGTAGGLHLRPGCGLRGPRPDRRSWRGDSEPGEQHALRDPDARRSALAHARPRSATAASTASTARSRFSGTLNAGGTSATTFLSLGGRQHRGVGNFDLTGVLPGSRAASRNPAPARCS